MFCEEASLQYYDIKPDANGLASQIEPDTDLALCLGGDGAILSLVRQAATEGILLGGVNTGHLGFLSSCAKDQFENLLHCLRDGSYAEDERSLLEVTKFNGQGDCTAGPFYALNEISLMRAQTGKMVDVDVSVDKKYFNRYHADGILVATPTGSSAYSLSAGGPLIWPHSGVVCLTPICPHSLTNRAVIIPDHVEITLSPHARRGRLQDQLIFSLDGRNTYPIALDEHLFICKAKARVRLLYLPNSDYATRLRSKLGW